ncbi:hypothetical protein C5167_030603 [Papaver somniferum]|nr:hypothetical protein C5167_030603 [Papaver somniferum]
MFTTSGIRVVGYATANMVTLTEIEELSPKIDKLVNLTEIEELSLRVDTLVLALDEISKELGDCQSKPSPELLARWKRFLTTKAKILLLLDHNIYVSEFIDEDWKSNLFDNFELVGSVMKKVSLIVKVIDEKLEAFTVDSSLSSNFTQQSSNPPVPDTSDGVLGSFPATNRSHKSGESQMTEDEIFFKSKSISRDLISVEGSIDESVGIDKTQKYKSTTMFLD